MNDNEHFCECAVCGLMFDMRDLEQVVLHEHLPEDLHSEAEGIVGEEIIE